MCRKFSKCANAKITLLRRQTWLAQRQPANPERSEQQEGRCLLAQGYDTKRHSEILRLGSKVAGSCALSTWKAGRGDFQPVTRCGFCHPSHLPWRKFHICRQLAGAKPWPRPSLSRAHTCTKHLILRNVGQIPFQNLFLLKESMCIIFEVKWRAVASRDGKSPVASLSWAAFCSPFPLLRSQPAHALLSWPFQYFTVLHSVLTLLPQLDYRRFPAGSCGWTLGP